MQLEPIAIIGIGCRFPGAKNPQAFWELIRDGVDGVSEVPKSRWDIAAYYDSDRSTPDKANTKWGGFLTDVDLFDPQFFGIAPKEAITMDPQQRLLLEVAWETLEDANYIPEKLRGSNTGVFIGIGTHDYSIMMWQQPVNEPYATTGTGNCIAANRLSYIFDFKGPSIAVDTACSSSLVAVHLACQSIWTGESAQALAGGVNVLLLPTIMVGFSKGGFMSSAGRCKSFDANADGYVRGEGAGLVLLKSLSQAQQDGDDIYGVIFSSAVNQDGYSNGIAAPNPKAQEAVLRSAYQRSGINPNQVSYIEAHGTGTKIGDPVEMKALGTVLGENRSSEDYCLVGSVKTNIGHTETAAGIAGIIKVALALKHKQIPPNLHFNQPNPAIAFTESHLQVVTELTPWESDQPLIAGVNSFGFGGTNAHIVMGEEKKEGSKQQITDCTPQLLTLSAKNQAALQELAQRYLNVIQKAEVSLQDLCFTANTYRSQFNHRLTCVTASMQQLQKQLTAFVSGKQIAGVETNTLNNQHSAICWLFTGQGSQYTDMGKQLYDTQPVFRQSIDRCAEILQSFCDRPLLEILFAGSTTNSQTLIIDQTAYAQPAIFALEYALAQLWLSWGVQPDYVMGHSIGEYVAACIAGVFDLEAALKLVAARGRLMDSLSSSGAMLAVFSSQAKVRELIQPYRDRVSIAAINSEQNIVISGQKAAIDELQKTLDRLNIKSTYLQVSQAFHSPLMKPILQDFAAVAESIKYHLPKISLISNITANLADLTIASSHYWVDHIIQPVNFADSFQLLLNQGINIFVEIGAKPTLSSLGKAIASNCDSSALLLPSLSAKKPDLQVMLKSLASLYHQGIKIDWQTFYQGKSYQTVKVPTYPFQRQKYWWEEAKFWTKNNAYRQLKAVSLLGDSIASDKALEKRFQAQINLSNPAYLQDHRLQDRVVFPATGYIEIALAAARDIYHCHKLSLSDFVIKKPLFLSSETTTIQTVITQEANCDRLQIFSVNTLDSVLTLHCEVIVEANQVSSSLLIDLAAIKLQLESELAIDNYYQKLSNQGLNYGANFQGIKKLWRGKNEALGYIEIPSNIVTAKNILHPALLDSCLQLIGAATDSQQGVYLPVSIKSLQLEQPLDNKVWAEINLKQTENQQIINARINLFTEQGKAVAVIDNLKLQYLSLASLQKLVDISEQKPIDSLLNCLYEVAWQSQKLESKNYSDNVLANNWIIVNHDRNRALKLADKITGSSILVSFGKNFTQISTTEYTVNPYQLQDFQQLWQNINRAQTSWGIIYLDRYQSETVAYQPSIQGCAAILHLLQSSDRLSDLVVVTHKTKLTTTQLQGTVWGLITTLNLEYPNLNCICLDLEDDHTETIVKEIQYSNLETQIAYQNNQRYVARLTPQDKQLNNSFRLQLSDFGTLDNLTLAPIQRRSPQVGEIEVEVKASGVNFRDVLNALGVLKEYLQLMGFTEANQVPFGGEGAGVVVAVGEGVSEFTIGDEVLVAQAVGSLSTHVTVDARFAIAKPDELTYTEAATIPTTFLTAYYGLCCLAKIKPGERVLIHAAAGGVGQAAIQLAQLVGAEIYATASVKKWEFLKASGVQYVMNSRTLDFAYEVMELTKGQGVDVVLNSLNGDFIPKNLEILAPQGRFVEIGKVGIWDTAEVKAKRDDVSYFPFDLLEVSNQNPDLIKTLFSQLKQKFVEKELNPLPHKVFPIEQADRAFRYMAQAKHIGKVVITLPNNNSQIVKPHSSYLITGGLGSLGLQVAAWLVTEGAKHLLLVGRNQPTAEAQTTIDELEALGATIEVKLADISDYAAVEQLINQLQLPLKGVIHAAGILDDGLVKTLDWERFGSILQPKVTGSWNLHLATQKLNLDWFVCFSSIVSVFGSVGQSNYGAANAFMDNLVAYRHSLGLPGLSINWSIWDRVGMASRLTSQQQQRLSQQGIIAIAPEQGLQILKQLLQQPTTQTIVFPVDWQKFLSQQLANPFFEQLQPQAKSVQAPVSSFVQQLIQTSETERYQLLQEHIREQIAKVLGFSDPEEIDPQEKFADLGMDSLMAVEFKNGLQASLGDAVSLTTAFDYPSVELLTNYIAQELLSEEIALSHNNIENSATVVENTAPSKPSQKAVLKPKTPVSRSKIAVKPEYSQFKLTPEYLNLKKDLERVEKLGNPFFSLHEGIAKDTIKTGKKELINYSSYNYLGMSGDPTVTAAAQEAIAQYGTSVSASRLLSGERPIHLELERAIADFVGTEDAIVYVGGHATNVSTIGHLFGEQDLIVCDALSHNSIKEGCKLSGSTIIDFPHNDIQALEAILERERTQYQKVLIAVEGIYSTDGDLAPLPEIVTLKQHYQTFLLVDEAHSIGVLGVSGKGAREHFDLKATDVDLWMGTLSKSFASCGGYIAGSKELIQYLKYTAPGFVFSVGMSPANTVSALAAIKLLQFEPERAIKLHSRAKFCLDLAKSKGFNTGYSADSPIIPIIVGEPNKAVRLSQLLAQQGININPMVYPSVPYDAARLRFFITCLHTEAQIETTIKILEQAIAKI